MSVDKGGEMHSATERSCIIHSSESWIPPKNNYSEMRSTQWKEKKKIPTQWCNTMQEYYII